MGGQSQKDFLDKYDTNEIENLQNDLTEARIAKGWKDSDLKELTASCHVRGADDIARLKKFNELHGDFLGKLGKGELPSSKDFKKIPPEGVPPNSFAINDAKKNQVEMQKSYNDLKKNFWGKWEANAQKNNRKFEADKKWDAKKVDPEYVKQRDAAYNKEIDPEYEWRGPNGEQRTLGDLPTKDDFVAKYNANQHKQIHN